MTADNTALRPRDGSSSRRDSLLYDEPRTVAAVIDSIIPAFLGLAATRVWMQGTFFASYTQSDDGLFSVANQFFYGMTMLLGALVAWKKPAPSQERWGVAWAGCVLMTLSTLLVAVGKESGAPVPLLAGALISGIGGAFGGAMWAVAYQRFDTGQAVLHGFLSLALGSLGGLALSFIPSIESYLVSMVMPAVALLCYQRALAAPVGTTARPASIYDGEPRSTWLLIVAGTAVFGLALGISRGFPAGEPVSMGVAERLVHQLGVVALSLLVIGWFLVKGRRLSFAFLWRIEILLVGVAMFVLAVLPGHFTALAIAVVNIADTFMLGVMWVTLQDIARRTSWDVFVVYGFGWAARILARDVGRVIVLAMGAFGPAQYGVTAAVGTVVFAMAMSMAILLTDGIPRRRPLFQRPQPPAFREADVGARPVSPGDPAAAPSTPSASPEDEASRGTQDAGKISELSPSRVQAAFPADEAWLMERYYLSAREAEIALLLAQGRSRPYIAQALYLSENTVRTHAKNIYTKLDVHTKQELIDLLHGGTFPASE